ncbi:Na+-driven multidrug efflux pump [Acetobacter estunensis NRIC 0472]|uniref:MATE family efflux transporter n=1 Tax=Acetobacter estunensis TaxID=104097 RepID=A0A967B2R6_9PROT|nr:MATE family efflux transporter [Acetobacter estunensis]NHO52655.1 MATE family efflux transporter [Acetobacter estunensis]GBQ22815.1 Na+-driven multidrug efflux pump [Acetobacter estunensis NRIC 0472]
MSGKTGISSDSAGDEIGLAAKGTNETVLRPFLVFMLPVMLDCVLQSLAGTIGNAYVGHMLGTRDLAAASTFYPLLLLLVSCGVGLGTGASVLVGQLWGAGRPEHARPAAAAALGIALGGGLGIGLGGQFLVHRILLLLHVPNDVLSDAASYCAFLLAGSPALIILVTTAITLRGAGDNMRPLMMMGIQIAVALVGTPLFLVMGFGLGGAAAATIAGWILALVFVGISLRHVDHPLAPTRQMLREMLPEKKIFLSVLRLGLPAMVEVMTMGLAEIALVGRINGFGSDMTAAYGLFTQTLTYIEYPGMAVGITVSVLTAHAIGARNEKRARAVLRTGFMIGLVLTGVLALAVSFAPTTVSLLFTSDPAVIALATHAFQVVMWSAVPLALGGILGAAMRASGDVMAPMSIMLGCVVLVELPVGYWCAHHYGAWGVWLGYPASFSTLFLCIALYWAVVWRHRPLLPLN